MRPPRILLALTALTLAGIGPAGAAVDGTVTGTVTVEPGGPCLMVGASSVDFGVLPFSSDSENVLAYGTVDGTGEQTYDLLSCSSVDQDFRVGGTDAVNVAGTVTWALRSGNPGQLICDNAAPNGYWLGIDGEDPEVPGSFLQAFLFPGFDIGVPNANGVNAVGAGDSRTVRNRIGMPCDTSLGMGDSFNLTLMYTAVVVP